MHMIKNKINVLLYKRLMDVMAVSAFGLVIVAVYQPQL